MIMSFILQTLMREEKVLEISNYKESKTEYCLFQ